MWLSITRWRQPQGIIRSACIQYDINMRQPKWFIDDGYDCGTFIHFYYLNTGNEI